MGTDPARVSTGWREQEFLSSVPGFLSFVVHEVLNAEEQCDNTHKVFCDLLAELIKFNKVRIFLFFSSYFESVWIHVLVSTWHKLIQFSTIIYGSYRRFASI